MLCHQNLWWKCTLTCCFHYYINSVCHVANTISCLSVRQDMCVIRSFEFYGRSKTHVFRCYKLVLTNPVALLWLLQPKLPLSGVRSPSSGAAALGPPHTMLSRTVFWISAVFFSALWRIPGGSEKDMTAGDRSGNVWNNRSDDVRVRLKNQLQMKG